MEILQLMIDQKGITQRQLSNITGINEPQISRWLNGINMISWERLNHIAKQLNLEIGYSLDKI